MLRHIHLKGLTKFRTAQAIQASLVSEFLSYKAAKSSPNPPEKIPPAPIPTILTFYSEPTYTLGRRDLNIPLSPSFLQSLESPLITSNNPTPRTATVVPTSRGGLTTFHGPGQLVIYPIIDLLNITPSPLSPRCYIHYLETTTIRALQQYNISGIRTSNPGVWINSSEKIASLGVHLRRNVSSYGVGLNMRVENEWWERIEACGLPGMKIVGVREVSIKNKSKPATSDVIIPIIWVNSFVSGLAELGRREKTGVDKKETSAPAPMVLNKSFKTWGWGDDVPYAVKHLLPDTLEKGEKPYVLNLAGGYVRKVKYPTRDDLP